jgi:menaquinol-cytochrome c reductase iron-sulfur subunit
MVRDLRNVAGVSRSASQLSGERVRGVYRFSASGRSAARSASVGADQYMTDTTTPRRRFLAWLSAGLGTVAAAAVGAPVIGFFFAPLMRRPVETWRSVGPAAGFRIGETVEVRIASASPVPWAGEASEIAAWLRREGPGEFVAFSVNCTHLGCPVRWMANARLFLCPCHGGVYDEDGAVAGGPPPRALTRYPVRVEDGTVLLRTSALPLG